MKSISIVSAALLLCVTMSPLVVAQTSDGLVINTPMSLTTCQNSSLTWSGAPAGQVFVSVVPGGQPSATPLVQFNATDANAKSLTWLVDVPQDTSVTILITDSTGKSTGSAPVTVRKGLDTSCVGKGQSVHPGTTSASTPMSASGTTASAATSNSNSSPSAGSTSSTSTTPATSSSSAKNTTTTSSTATTPSTASTSGNNTTTSSTTANKPSTGTTSTTTDKKTATDAAMVLHCQGILIVVALAFTSTLFLMA